MKGVLSCDGWGKGEVVGLGGGSDCGVIFGGRNVSGHCEDMKIKNKLRLSTRRLRGVVVPPYVRDAGWQSPRALMLWSEANYQSILSFYY